MIGMLNIKKRRLTEIKLDECYPETFVGEYVPFYFCPRSVMLYLISKCNPELTYQGGHGPIVHLEASLHRAVQWAKESDCKWAFSLSNAGAYGVEFRNTIEQLDEIDWTAVAANNWSRIKHGKQAEFLMHGSFPWNLVERIGVHSMTTGRQATAAIAVADHQPQVEVMTGWYY